VTLASHDPDGPDRDGRKSGIVVIAAADASRQDGRMQPRLVVIPIFDGVQSLDVTGPLEVFTEAADGVARYRPAADPGYRVITASVGGRQIQTSSGLGLMPATDLRHVLPAEIDTIIVPGGPRTECLSPEIAGWLRRGAPPARRVASVCTGAFLLAEAGLLTGKRATTHWAFGADLARRFPDVCVDTEPIFIRDGAIATSAGVTAGIDLALALVEEDIGRDAALAVARSLVVYLRRPGGQAQFSAHLRAQSAQRAPLREVQQWISEHPGADLSVPALAAKAGLSARQFARAFAAETGVPPGKHVAAVRLEAAQRMLADSGLGVAQVARACGYGTPEAMRRAFVHALGVPPVSYRSRF
jgi:transcriptional regulator GlxA family with amidase domain